MNTEETKKINLHFKSQVLTVKKDILCAHSDYFRAMFSGNYIETEFCDMPEDVVDVNSMNIILKYMNSGSIDLSEYTVTDIRNLMVAANYIQVTELIKHIENCLDQQLTVSNCMGIMDTAEQFSYAKSEYLSAAFGLLSFKSMKPEYIPSIDILFWYLSHPYLDTDNEINVFKCGLDWISQTKIDGNAVLIVVGCLDVKRLTIDELKQMSILIKEYKNSLVENVIKCLKWLRNSDEISLKSVKKKRSILCQIFTPIVYMKIYHIVKESKHRKLKYTPVIQRRSFDDSNCMYTFTEDKYFHKVLYMPEKNLWGWNIAAWGTTKLVLVGGEYYDCERKASGSFMMDVMVYDTLRKEWINHGVKLPPRRHAGVAVLGDSLFIVGGQIRFKTAEILYNLKERTYKKIVKFPESSIEVNICSHKGSIYAAKFPRKIYKYEDSGQQDCWRTIQIVDSHDNSTMRCLKSFNDYIYSCSGYKFVQRLRPEIDNSWQNIEISGDFAAMCSLRTHLQVFIRPLYTFGKNETTLKAYSEQNLGFGKIWDKGWKICGIRTIYMPQIKYDDFAASCLLVMDLPPSLRMKPSTYYQTYISNYS